MRRAIQWFGLLGCTTILAGQSVEQTSEGTRGTVAIVTQFDGLGVGFGGPQGTATLRNPSDNSARDVRIAGTTTAPSGMLAIT